MKYYALTETISETVLDTEYKEGREIGPVTLGETCLFFKVKRKINYIPYGDITRAFRRVQLVGMKMCCGKGDLEVENLVICGAGDKELAMIQLPGARAGVIMLEELERRIPGIKIGKPEA
jgi:hypothetical protein